MSAQKPPSLQDGTDRADPAVQLLWQDPDPWLPAHIDPQYADWLRERAAVRPAPFGENARKAYRRHEI